ncbi:biotin transporter BioY, partial [Thomasclavelia spiroformis]
IFKASFGYLIGFIACAYFTGLICEKVTLTDFKKYALAVFCGLLATYIIGLSYKYFILNFYLNTPISWKLVLLSCFPIDLPCDIALSILAIILATKLKKSGGLHVKKDIR